MLSANTSVAIPPESHFIPYLHHRYDKVNGAWNPGLTNQLARDIASDAHFLEWDLDPAVTLAKVTARRPTSFRDTVREFFRAYADHEGKTRWGDKTPHYIFHLDTLRELFPTLLVIEVIRDGRDVACSHLSLARRHRQRWVAQSSPTAAAWWRAAIREGRRQAAAQPQTHLVLRYEALVEDPEFELKRVCEFLSLPYDPAMLEYAERVHTPSRVVFERARSAIVPKARDWRTEMTRREIAEFESVAGTELEQLGYGLASIPASAWLRESARARARWFLGYRRARRGLRRAGHRHTVTLARIRGRWRSASTTDSITPNG